MAPMTYDRRAFLQSTLAASIMLGREAPAAAQTTAAPLFPGFQTRKIETSGATIHTVHGGSGPPLLLLHGYPQTHVEWFHLAPRLAQKFTVVMTDLRGYGDSSKPPGEPNHANYSKRAMAQDQIDVMRTLGFQKFAVVAHDRGARVAWRLCVEHPDVVTKAALLDITPLPYASVTRQFATENYHWFFLLQPAPIPETLIGNSAEFYLRSRFSRPTVGTSAIPAASLAEYLRCFNNPATIHATTEDYRAGATIDIEHSNADGDRKVMCPLLVLWGQRSFVGRMEPVLDIWRQKAVNVTGKALAAGHFLPEEVPEETLAELMAFL
jgi:haloacetate dehalogenase